MNKFVLAILNFYRNHISPNKPPCCRFTPTCSEYAKEAFEKYGFFKALRLTIWRLLRCNPFSKSGYDPLP
ncbi:MAG: membrane protein insertion efficiency factor YidD [Clostridia bacterium]|nr:membrane protein insertion efficiency factor YidD [Clostridia bacterium]